MDAFWPLIPRKPGTPVTPDERLVMPVFRDARLRPIKPHEQKYLILYRPSRRAAANNDGYPQAPYTTPEEDQHTDKDGHLDIFV